MLNGVLCGHKERGLFKCFYYTLQYHTVQIHILQELRNGDDNTPSFSVSLIFPDSKEIIPHLLAP